MMPMSCSEPSNNGAPRSRIERRRQLLQWLFPRCFDVGIVYFQVDEVPVLSLRVVVAAIVAVAVFVCPGGFTGEIVRRETVRVRIEHCGDLGLDRGVEKVFGDQRDRLMSVVAPCKNPSRCE